MVVAIIAICPYHGWMPSMIDRIAALIKDSGLTQGDFGRRTGIEASKLSKSLGGLRRFTSLEIARIAQESGTTVDWILTGAEDELSAAARTGADDTSPGKALARARELVTMRADLRQFGVGRDWTLAQVGTPQGRLWVEQGTYLAESASRLMPGVEATQDLAMLIEASFNIDVAIQDIDGLDGLAAATQSARLIMVSPTPNFTRQRFTLMHELAHLLASDDQKMHQDANVMAKGGEGEVRANAFAAAMLMPGAALRDRAHAGLDEAGFCQLSWDLMVSPRALSWRLFNLGLITEEQRSQWHSLTTEACATQLSRQSEYLDRSARSAQTRVPALLFADAWSAYEQGLTTLRPVANLLGVSSADLREKLADLELG